MSKVLKLLIIFLFLIFSIFGFTQSNTVAEPTEVEFQAIVDKLKESTVSILISELEFQNGHGSGMIYKKENSPNGMYYYYVVTNNHVVNSSSYVKLQMHNGTIEIGDIYGVPDVSASGADDIAVVRFESEKTYQIIELPSNPSVISPALLTVGQKVFGIGTPANLQYANSVSDIGIVSKQTRSFIIHTSNINPGNSGGPLFTVHGKFIGINTQRIETVNGEYIDGLAESIIVDRVAVLVNQLTENVKPKLGISIQNHTEFLTFNYREQYGEQANNFRAQEKIPLLRQGVVIAHVNTTRPSFNILEVYDLVVGLNDQEVNNREDISKIIGEIKVGNVYTFDIYRKNIETGNFELMKKTVTIK